jgi:aryl-alcohol dehydrogenase-like predicted oxidoreductase
MESRKIGALDVPVAGLGGNNFGTRLDETRTRAVVTAALEAGVRLFDTADLYGDGTSERLLGRALGGSRTEVSIATKFGMRTPPRGLAPGGAAWVEEACEQSRERLGVERIDLYWFHQPDPGTPIAETLAAMNRLVEEGKVREIGCSNFSAEQLDEAARVAAAEGLRPFAAVQNQYSLLHRAPELGVLAACERLGMAFVPFFPLSSGALTGKYRRGLPAPAGTRLGGGGGQPAEEALGLERLAVVERLARYAEAHGHTLLELALSWLASRPAVAAVIPGATSPEQVRANTMAAEAWRLTPAEIAEVRELVEGRDD